MMSIARRSGADVEYRPNVPDTLESLIKVLGMHEMPRRVTAMRTFKRTTSGKVVRTLLP